MIAAPTRTALPMYVARFGLSLCSFLVRTPPVQEPYWPPSQAVFWCMVDGKMFSLFQNIELAFVLFNWPNDPSILRDSAKYILQDICLQFANRLLTDAENRRVQQLVARVDEYCWLKGLPTLPVDWIQ